MTLVLSHDLSHHSVQLWKLTLSPLQNWVGVLSRQACNMFEASTLCSRRSCSVLGLRQFRIALANTLLGTLSRATVVFAAGMAAFLVQRHKNLTLPVLSD